MYDITIINQELNKSNDKMNLFENKNYQSIIFLAVSIALLLISFGSIKIFESKNFESITNKIVQEDKNYKITGFAAENQEKNKVNKTLEKDKKAEKEEKLYSEKSYTIYYVILIILVICIVITSLAYFLPLMKVYT